MKVLLIGGSSAGKVIDVPEDAQYINTAILPGGLRGGFYAGEKALTNTLEERYQIFRVQHMAFGCLTSESIEEVVETLAKGYLESLAGKTPITRY